MIFNLKHNFCQLRLYYSDSYKDKVIAETAIQKVH
ncbi:hypothetical protein HDE70_003505 [Pedobacter cryoconitis]|nr:hypothetical protein [Pedobacter cryoconitis]